MNNGHLSGLIALMLAATTVRSEAVTLLSDSRVVTLEETSQPTQSAAPIAPFANFSAALSTVGLGINQTSSVTTSLIQSSSSFFAVERPNVPPRIATGTSIFDITFNIQAPTLYDLAGYREVWFWGENSITFSGPSGVILHNAGPTVGVGGDNFSLSSGVLSPGIYNLNLTSLVVVTEPASVSFEDSTPGRNDVTLTLSPIPDGGEPIALFGIAVAFLSLFRRRSSRAARQLM